MADLVFAFDPAIDRPIAVPEAAPADVGERIATAAAEAFEQAAALVVANQATALVVCGRLLDPRRASPAQGAMVRRLVQHLATHGAQTVFVADGPAACHDLARMLGEPAGLRFAMPGAAATLDLHGLMVEITAATAATGVSPPVAAGLDLPPLMRRIVVGWDTALWHGRWNDEAAGDAALAAPAARAQPDTLWIWGSRRRRPLPDGVHHLPALQARSIHESCPGVAGTLTLLDRAAGLSAVPHANWRGSWREIATHRVGWRSIAVESPAGGDEELATALWAALEAMPSEERTSLELVRCAVQCGTSVARRVRVAEISAETLARVRQLYDAKTFRVWCHELFADPGEPLEPLGHARSGSRPGTTTSFSSALADIVTAIELSPSPPIAADLAREAGWLALELVEAT